jgi:hypothetical protein
MTTFFANAARSMIATSQHVVLILLIPFYVLAFRDIALSSSSSYQNLLRQYHISFSRRLMNLEDGGLEDRQPSPSSWSPAAAAADSSDTPTTPLSEEDLVRRILTGYDSTQAAALSLEEGRYKIASSMPNATRLSRCNTSFFPWFAAQMTQY